METSLTVEDQLYQRATKLIDCHVNIDVTWRKHDFPSCEIYHSDCHWMWETQGLPDLASPGDNL